MIKSSNPALGANVFASERSFTANEGTMTLQGTVNKTLILLACVVAPAAWVWAKLMPDTTSTMFAEAGVASQAAAGVNGIMMLGAFGGFIMAMITIFNKKGAPITAPIYAVCQGLFLGGISAIFELRYPGIVIQAITLTFGTLFCLLMAYKSGLIKATENFKLGIVAATGAVCLIYVVDMIMGFFHSSITMVHSNGTFGIIFSVIVVAIAALNLVIDFDFIEKGAEMGAPKYMEWYGAFGLMVTLIWLYMEILRLLVKLQGNRR